MFDCEGSTFEGMPVPSTTGPCVISVIGVGMEEVATGGTVSRVAWSGEGTERRLDEEGCAGVGTVGGGVLRAPGAVRGLLSMLALGETKVDAVLTYRWR